jgi:hypothetical protein
LSINLFSLWADVYSLISEFDISHPNGISFKYIVYNVGDNVHPRYTSQITGVDRDNSELNSTPNLCNKQGHFIKL